MQRTGFIVMDNERYEVLIRTQNKTTEWITVKRKIPTEEPYSDDKYEVGLDVMLDSFPDMQEALKAGSTIRV